MKPLWRILTGLLCLLFVGVLLIQFETSPSVIQPASQRGPNVGAAQPGGQLLPGGAQIPNLQGPDVSQPVVPGISPAVRDLPVDRSSEPLLDREINPRQNPDILNIDPGNPDPYDTGETDPLIRRSQNQAVRTPSVSLTFEGIGTGGAVPPDTVGDVGPNHYVQMVNIRFQIFDKSGNSLAGPTNINQLWSGQGNNCETLNDGDPIVLYDRLADRWLISQFYGAFNGPGNDGICVAISQTADPTGAFYLYQFPTPGFPDYFKFAVWPDAYYMSANESSYTAYAFDRTNMLAGNAATSQRFSGQTNLLLPGDLDGPTAPPANSPNYFYTFKDNAFHGGSDRIEVYAFDVDFVTPANSTFTLVASIPVSSFTYTVCGFFVLACVPQPGTAQKIDAVSEWPMWRLQYRNFGTHESLVGNFAVDVGSDQSGIRWFELRRTGGAWSLHQEGTHAPDSNHRFMGSIAMDQDGNMALGYSVSSSSVFPSIRYATRLASDAAGTFQAEETLQAGGGSQTTSFARWGDYSSLNVDPADDCTFWYTNEYYSTTSIATWRTRIGTFKIPSCGTPLTITQTVNDALPIAGQTITYTLVVKNNDTVASTGGVISDTLAAGLNFVNNSVSATPNPPGANFATSAADFPNLVTNLTINSGQTITFTFAVTVDNSAALGSVLNNTAAITSTQVPTPVTSLVAVTVVEEDFLPVILKN